MRAVMVFCEFVVSVLLGAVMVLLVLSGDFESAAVVFAVLLLVLSMITVSESSKASRDSKR